MVRAMAVHGSMAEHAQEIAIDGPPVISWPSDRVCARVAFPASSRGYTAKGKTVTLQFEPSKPVLEFL